MYGATNVVHDACANGTKLTLLTMEDEYTRESLAIAVGGSLPTRAVVRVLQPYGLGHGVQARIAQELGGSEATMSRAIAALWVSGYGCPCGGGRSG